MKLSVSTPQIPLPEVPPSQFAEAPLRVRTWVSTIQEGSGLAQMVVYLCSEQGASLRGQLGTEIQPCSAVTWGCTLMICTEVLVGVVALRHG